MMVLRLKTHHSTDYQMTCNVTEMSACSDVCSCNCGSHMQHVSNPACLVGLPVNHHLSFLDTTEKGFEYCCIRVFCACLGNSIA